MSDTYNAIRDAFAGHADRMLEEFIITQREYQRPSAIYRPTLSLDGNQWAALYGENLQDGVAGFGDSPELAMWDFDKAWGAKVAALGGKE